MNRLLNYGIWIFLFASLSASASGRNAGNGGEGRVGRVISCNDSDGNVAMLINPDMLSSGRIEVDGQLVTIIKETEASDGQSSFDLSDGSSLTLHVIYDGKDVPATLSKLGVAQTMTCRSEKFHGNGW